ncbi:MAG: hypothetical protein QM626_07865 [Microbacterium sp.]|uniref:hypothetical protein n=1 Tax=Microbacterium sp. TaxID=51671 RepID=UPI0039E62279
MTTPDAVDPLRNDALNELKSQDIEELIAPEEKLFQQISHPEPTDAIGYPSHSVKKR